MIPPETPALISPSRKTGLHRPAGRLRVSGAAPEWLTGFGSEVSDTVSTFDGWIVDALFGTGLTGPLREPYDRIVAAINASPAKVLAIDIPSGLDSTPASRLGHACVLTIR